MKDYQKKKSIGIMIASLLCLVMFVIPFMVSANNVHEKYSKERPDLIVQEDEDLTEEETLENNRPFTITDLTTKNGVITYSLDSKDQTIYYSKLFTLLVFNEDDIWEDTTLTYHMKEDHELTEFPLMPTNKIEEQIDITPYLTKLTPGMTYHIHRYITDKKAKKSYLVKFQFELTPEKEIDSLYHFIYEEDLKGNPLFDIIPNPKPEPEAETITPGLEDEEEDDDLELETIQ